MGGIVPGLPPIKDITQQYMKTGPLPPNVNPKMLKILFDWIKDDVHSRIDHSIWEHSVVLDRTGVYTMAFLNAYRDNPYITRSTLQLIGIVAYFLADCFFGQEISKSKCVYLCDGAYTDKQFTECLNMYMMSNIDFFGTTFLDKVVEMHDKLPKLMLKFRQFNYACFQHYLFPKDSSELSPEMFDSKNSIEELIHVGGRRRTRRLRRLSKNKRF